MTIYEVSVFDSEQDGLRVYTRNFYSKQRALGDFISQASTSFASRDVYLIVRHGECAYTAGYMIGMMDCERY